MRRRGKFLPGATRLSFADMMTALIMLGILAYAAFLQFPTYRRNSAASPAATASP